MRRAAARREAALMDVHARRGGVSAPAYGVMVVLGVGGLLFEDATNGRSWGVFALAGLVVIVDCLIYLRRPSVSAPRRTDEVARPLSAIAGIVVGAVFVVLGVLAAAGTITFQ